MITLLAAAAAEAALFHGLFHLVVILIVIAILYYIGAWIIGALAPATGAGTVLKLWLILCGLIALYFVVMFLLTLAP